MRLHKPQETISLFRAANGRPLHRLHSEPVDTLEREFLLRGQSWQV